MGMRSLIIRMNMACPQLISLSCLSSPTQTVTNNSFFTVEDVSKHTVPLRFSGLRYDETMESVWRHHYPTYAGSHSCCPASCRHSSCRHSSGCQILWSRERMCLFLLSSAPSHLSSVWQHLVRYLLHIQPPAFPIPSSVSTCGE